jgi:hypothetical protein
VLQPARDDGGLGLHPDYMNHSVLLCGYARSKNVEGGCRGQLAAVSASLKQIIATAGGVCRLECSSCFVLALCAAAHKQRPAVLPVCAGYGELQKGLTNKFRVAGLDVARFRLSPFVPAEDVAPRPPKRDPAAAAVVSSKKARFEDESHELKLSRGVQDALKRCV